MQTTRRQFALSTAALAVAACLPQVAAAQTVDDLKKKGKLVVGMLVDFPPFGILNNANQPDGYDADVAKLLGQELGVAVEIVPVVRFIRILAFILIFTMRLAYLLAPIAIHRQLWLPLMRYAISEGSCARARALKEQICTCSFPDILKVMLCPHQLRNRIGEKCFRSKLILARALNLTVIF